MTATVELLPVLVGVWLLLVGLYGAATTRHLIHLVFSVSVLHSGAWLLLLGVGHRPGVSAPIVDEDVVREGASHQEQIDAAATGLADPVVQALTVTDIVVNAAVTALLLGLAVRVRRRYGTDDPRELGALRG